MERDVAHLLHKCYTIYMERVVVYVPQMLHRDLRTKLSREGKTLSGWVRVKMEEELPGKETITPKEVVKAERAEPHETPHPCENPTYKCLNQAYAKINGRWLCAFHTK